MKKNKTSFVFPDFFKRENSNLLCRRWLLAIVMCLGFSFGAFAQQQKVSIHVKDVDVSVVFRQIKEQTKLNFVYDPDQLASMSSITMDVKNVSVDSVLSKLFTGTSFEYRFEMGAILIKRKEKQEQNVEMVTLTGSVKDKDGSSLPGVTVVLKGLSLGTVTDVDGNYKISLPVQEGITLVFSFVGMVTQEIKVTDQRVINVVLEEDVEKLKEVVVTGIFNRAKESYTGAVTTITEKELKKFGNRSIITNIRNIDPSFNILTDNFNGSDPNSTPQIQMRGTSSLPQNVDNLKNNVRTNLNQPLFIMDGFEISLERVLDMNPDRVETITLLKDASATALYGSRGANGVVVITTKKPVMGKLRVTYRGGLNMEIPDLTDYDVLNAREKLQLEYDAGVYTLEKSSYYDANEQMSLDEIYNKKLADVERGVDTYWLSKPLRIGCGQRHDITVDGGDQAFRYAVNVAVNDVKGVMKGSDRLSFDGSLTLSYFGKSISFSNDLTIGLSKSNNSPYGTFDQYVQLNPYYTPYDKEGNLKYYLENNAAPHLHTVMNPLYNAILNSTDKAEYTNIRNNTSLSWRIIDGLRIDLRVGLSKNINTCDKFLPAKHALFNVTELDRKGSYSYLSGKSLNYDVNLTLNYNKIFAARHMVNIGGNFDLSQQKSFDYTFLVEGFPNEDIDFLATAFSYAKDSKPSGNESLTRRIGITGNMNYMYDQRYALDFSFRMDGSSQFGSDKRFAPFWSVGLAWNVHKEKFFHVNWISMLKLRYSYGVTGSQQFSSYQAMRTYKYYIDDSYANWIGTAMVAIGNDKLEWQETKKSNVGFDLEVFNGILTIKGDYYINTTDNLLSENQLPLSSGFSSYTENIGEVENRGFELMATGRIFNKGSILWTVSGSILRNTNKIVRISEALKKANEELELAAGTNPNFIYREGEAMDAIYVVKSLGIDPSNGRELFLDRFGQKTYTWDARDKINAGIPEKYRGTVSTMFRYKNLMANLSCGYAFGGKLYNNTLIDKVENADVRNYNVDRRVYEGRWISAGQVTQYKDVNNTEMTQMSSRFVQKNNYFECYNINVSYEVASEWLENNLSISRLSITGDFGEPFRFSTVKQERGIYYPYSRKLSFMLSVIF